MDGPKLPGTIGANQAEAISKLWALAYTPGMSAQEAAGLQIAIWKTIAPEDFSILGDDYGASLLLQNLEGYAGAGAKLVILSGPGQDYVTSVPEGGSTLILLSAVAVGLALHRVFVHRRPSRGNR